MKIIYLSSFPPRVCGIATFTSDLTGAMDDLLGSVVDSRIAALNTNAVPRSHYPRQVIFQIDAHAEREYLRVAESINKMDDVKLVNVQHEFGLFGGDYGSNILSFLRVLKKPSIVTFHSVLPSPNDELRRIVCSVVEEASGVTAMTNLSRAILVSEYGIDEKRISVIPHGIHAVPYSSSEKAKAALGLSGKVSLLTFGFLSRGKGIEYVIEALPKIVKAYPNLTYTVLGVTHPNVIKEEGESYRNSLIEKVFDLGLSSHVNFYNEYASLDGLLLFLQATDIYVSTSLDPNQAVSGTLSYALGCGRPVISTSFAQAKEIITPESGLLVNFRDPNAYGEALTSLLEDPLRREQFGKNAYFRTRNMIWENVALEYLKLFSKHSDDIAEVSKYKNIPRVNLNHMFRLTDDFGIIQFSELSLPDIGSGYTVDDNARALIVVCLFYGDLAGRFLVTASLNERKRNLLKYAQIYLRFIEYVQGENGLFGNYVKSDRTINSALNRNENLEDANGRTLWALAVAAVVEDLPRSLRDKALAIFRKRIKNYEMFESPRATAFYIKGLCLLLKADEQIEADDLNEVLISHCDRLLSLYRGVSSEEWAWFESYLTYSNAVLPEALLLGHLQTGNSEYSEIALRALDFLIQKTFHGGVYAPIGQDGWHHKMKERHYFDQQPEDVSAMACVLATAYRATGRGIYKELMYEAFNWFLGDNSLKQVVYDRATGGCYDGVGERHINLNQGAESTTAYLLARLAVMGSENNLLPASN